MERGEAHDPGVRMNAANTLLPGISGCNLESQKSRQGGWKSGVDIAANAALL